MASALAKGAAGAVVAAGASLATLAAQARHVARLGLPEHPDLDASGPIGPGDADPLDVLVVGDSSCTGPGLDHPDDIWVRQLLAAFGDRRFEVHSFAVGGSRCVDVKGEQLPAAGDRPRDLAIVSVGANDAIHGATAMTIQSQLTQIVEHLLGRCHVVVLPGVGDVGSAPRIPFPLSAAASTAARQADLAHARVARTRPHVLKAPMWQRSTDTFRTRTDIWSTDRYHPNAAGHAIWAQAVEGTMARALEHVDHLAGSSSAAHDRSAGAVAARRWRA